MHDVYCTTDFFKRNVTFLFRWMQQINQSGVGSRPKELKGEEIEKKHRNHRSLPCYGI